MNQLTHGKPVREQNISRIKVFLRSAYFKTALNTAIGEKPKDIDVQECSPKVLSVVLRFIYGISLPVNLDVEDAKQVLLMADLYLMEDLKEAVIVIMAKQLTDDNIQEISKMAEKFTAPKLMDTCADFIISNYGYPDEGLIAEVPQLATLCFKKQNEKLKIANLVLGTDLKANFKKREDFISDLEYKDYVAANLKIGMLVACNEEFGSILSKFNPKVGKGSVGSVTGLVTHDDSVSALVKWHGKGGLETKSVSLLNLDIIAEVITEVKI